MEPSCDTLDLNSSWDSDEILAESPSFSLKDLDFNKNLLEVQEMLGNFHFGHINSIEKNDPLDSTQTIKEENEKLKVRIAELEKIIKSNNRKSRDCFDDLSQKKSEYLGEKRPDFSQSSIKIGSCNECSFVPKTRCTTHDMLSTQGSSLKNNYVYKLREFGETLKRYRPNGWFQKSPKKKFLQDVVISQLTLFKF